MPPVEGEIASLSVPQVLRDLATAGISGCLILTNTTLEVHLYLMHGAAYFASVSGSTVRLGTRLVSAGIITKEQLEEALETQRLEKGARRLGDIFVDSEVVDRPQLEWIVRQQIEDAVFEVLHWDVGHYRFDEDAFTDQDFGFRVGIDDLVIAGARRFRDWRHLSKQVPSLEGVPYFAGDASSISASLTNSEWQLLSQIDGVATVEELARACGVTDLEAARTTNSLITTGLVALRLPEDFTSAGFFHSDEEVAEQLARAYELERDIRRAFTELTSPESDRLSTLTVTEADEPSEETEEESGIPVTLAISSGPSPNPDIDQSEIFGTLTKLAASASPTQRTSATTEEAPSSSDKVKEIFERGNTG